MPPAAGVSEEGRSRPAWRSRVRGALLDLLLACASLVVGLLCVEGALRLLAGHDKGGKEQRERNRYTEYDPVLSWRKTPGAHVVYDRRDFHVEFDVNSRGLRGPDRPYEKPVGTRRVLALGDSFLEAFMVGDPETVTARLEDHLGQRGCRSEVINGGTIGYSTDQEYLFYREEGRRYSPDVVVLFAYHNDIPWLIQVDYLGYPKPMLDFSTPPPRIANAPVPQYRPAPVVGAPAVPFRGSYLFAAVGDAVEGLSADTYEKLASWGLWEPLHRLPLTEELRLYRMPELGHLRPAWSAFTWTMAELAKATRADGARLVVAYIPSRMEVDPRAWERTRVRYGLDPAYERTAVAKRVRSILGRLEVPFLDLTEPMARAQGFLTPVFCPTDGHWNARGQDVAARAVADALLAGAALPGCH